MTLQISIVTAFQIGVYFWTINQEWFCSVSDNFPDCFVRDESGDIIRAKKGFHLTANQMPRNSLKTRLKNISEIGGQRNVNPFSNFDCAGHKVEELEWFRRGFKKMPHFDWSLASSNQNLFFQYF